MMMTEGSPINTRMLALLTYEYLRSNVARLDAPDYTHTNHTQRVILYLAEPLGLRHQTDYKNFDLAFLDGDDIVMLMEDEDISRLFKKEELPKLVEAEASLRVGITYDSSHDARSIIVENVKESLKRRKGNGLFLLILGYRQDTRPEDPYIRFDGFLFDGDGALIWKDQDIQNRRTNLRTERAREKQREPSSSSTV